ncbi:hypothetical protein RvY_06985-2 [Ramazzottius varieornatus]|uniref:Cytochrome P450 n=1 Tax=Ramazzottius varieornatus TaxID=947166 RepID=A0A1D1V3R9_RAMVA|nr:hypothetical protein RvY_06985-2 [Ramazzottius varieornatus]
MSLREEILTELHRYNQEQLPTSAFSLYELKMASLSIFFLVCAAVLLVISYLRKLLSGSTTKNFPPGPRGLPILGNLHQMGKQPSRTIRDMSKIYGPTVGLHLGSTPMVVLHDPATVRKVYNDENVTGRPQTQILNFFFKNRGIVMAEGQLWKEHRRFALSTLRNLGMGKSWLEDAILDEVQEIIEQFRTREGAPFDARRHLTLAVSNVVCALVFGRRFDHNDKRFIRLCNMFADYMALVNSLLPVQAFPILKDIPCLKYQKLFDEFMVSIKEIGGFTNEMIEEHKTKVPEAKNGMIKQDYITAYMEEKKKQDPNTTTFDDEQLMFSIVNLFTGGTESSASTLLWGMIHLARFPDVQQKIHKEIDAVLGGEKRLVILSDRGQLRYTDAALQDVQRLAAMAPLSLPHSNFEAMEIDGYNIPARSFIHQNIFSLHYDEKYWAKPNELYPEHFLDENGDVMSPAAFMSLSVGKRSCLGEALAKMETFLFFSNIVGSFRITGNKEELDRVTRNMTLGILNSPLPFDIQLIPRRW